MAKDAPDWRVPFALYWVITAVLAGRLAFSWLMSPFGLGFARWPEGSARGIAEAAFQVSYFVGIPGILIAQGASLIFAHINS